MDEPLAPLSAGDYATEIGWAPPEPDPGTPHRAGPGDTFMLKDVAIGSEVWFEFFTRNEPAYDGVIGPKPYGLVLPVVNVETVPGPYGPWTRVTGKMPNGRLVTCEGNSFPGRKPPRPARPLPPSICAVLGLPAGHLARGDERTRLALAAQCVATEMLGRFRALVRCDSVHPRVSLRIGARMFKGRRDKRARVSGWPVGTRDRSYEDFGVGENYSSTKRTRTERIWLLSDGTVGCGGDTTYVKDVYRSPEDWAHGYGSESATSSGERLAWLALQAAQIAQAAGQSITPSAG